MAATAEANVLKPTGAVSWTRQVPGGCQVNTPDPDLETLCIVVWPPARPLVYNFLFWQVLWSQLQEFYGLTVP
jgi:hypothetical protein